MDPRQSTQRFIRMLSHMCELNAPSHPGWNAMADYLQQRVTDLLNDSDSAYLPSFKCMDFVATCANIATSIAAEPQLRPQEALGLLKSMLTDDTEIVRRFRLEAALERARYEPMMLHETELADAVSHRHAMLQKRWHAMREAQQKLYAIGEAYLREVDQAVTLVLESDAFRDYRMGPLMQFFAEMLHTARLASYQAHPPSILAELLHPSGRLWRSYALKSRRFRSDPPSALQQEMFSASFPPAVLH